MSEVQLPPPPPPPPPSTPPTPPPPATPGPPQFDFAKPFTYVFDDPRWLQKVLIGGLFYLAGVFIVGWFFVMGYMARVARNVVAGETVPLPEWEDVGSFFNEGVRMVGVVLAYIVPFIVIAIAFMIPSGLMSAIDNEGVQAVGGVMMGCFACLMVPLAIIVLLFMPASLLFAAIEQDFSVAFQFTRLWAFIKANIGNYLLAIAVYLIARFLAGFGIRRHDVDLAMPVDREVIAGR